MIIVVTIIGTMITATNMTAKLMRERGMDATKKGERMRLVDEDVISRQAALDCFHNWIDKYGDVHTPDEMVEYRAIEALPSVQPERRWILVSEKLPEVGRSVLISVAGMYVAEGCLRDDGNWAQFRWNGIQKKDMVDAWMSLPKPYKEE